MIRAEIHNGSSQVPAGIVEWLDPSVESGKSVLHQVLSGISVPSQGVRHADHAWILSSVESDERIYALIRFSLTLVHSWVHIYTNDWENGSVAANLDNRTN
jgi:hypothetical protein